MNWKQMIESFLLEPELTIAKTQKYNENNCCLSITYLPDGLHQGILPSLSIQYAYRATLLKAFPEHKYPVCDDATLQLFFDQPLIALNAAFQIPALLQPYSVHVCVSLGYGDGYILDNQYKSVEAIRSKRLNFFTNVHEVTATEAFIRAINLPDGVGTFSCSDNLKKSVGFAFWTLKDYR
jgi:hypothetical protein